MEANIADQDTGIELQWCQYSKANKTTSQRQRENGSVLTMLSPSIHPVIHPTPILSQVTNGTVIMPGLKSSEAVAIETSSRQCQKVRPIWLAWYAVLFSTSIQAESSWKGINIIIIIRYGLWIHQLAEVALVFSNKYARRELVRRNCTRRQYGRNGDKNKATKRCTCIQWFFWICRRGL